ncbi:MAG TPA: hypothetical protein PKD99_03535 [Sphingopyxis sp.]|nr:hypothetical protein [Sphingopyxis sp.]HMP44154.1 hypothetical protein [Sphingopyxis sp.]HMQ19302.1 hypothetical protein [Sphingopyxis sp.]
MLFESAETTILFWLVVGLLAFLGTLTHLIKSTRGTLGFPIAFLLALLIMHCGAVAHLASGYFHQYNPFLYSLGYTKESVALGLQVSAIGFVSMAAGIFCTSYFGQQDRLEFDARHYPARFLRLAERSMLIIGGFFFFAVLILPSLGAIPTIGAVVTSSRNLLPVALCFAILRRVWLREGMQLWQIGAIASVIPLANLIGTAILADAVAIIIFIACFWLAITGRRFGMGRIILAMAAGSYVFLFLAINYLLVRDEFRDIVWEPTSTYSERVDGLGAALMRFTPLSSDDEDQLFALDARLNQSLFTGMAVEKLELQPDTYENGATLAAGLFAFVPRLIWTDKPVRGGSEFLTKHTGYPASKDTTYGIGPYFESYVNYGLTGVILFGFLFAALVRWIDLRCYRAMVTGRMTEAVPLAIGALALVQPLSTFASTFSTFYASLIIGFLAAKMLERYLDISLFAESQARSRVT